MLGLELLDRLDVGEDIVLSPYGLRRALGVVRGGAVGESRAALDAVLGPDDPPVLSVTDPAVVLALAQAAWLKEGYAAGPALTLDTGPLALGPINAWANEKTAGMIPSILARVDPDDICAITDAAYVDAAWAVPFDPARTAGEMMVRSGRMEHATDRAIRLPYGEGELRFVAVMGDWGELPWRFGQGTLELPRFSIESTHDLNAPLSALGLGPAFAFSHDLDELVIGPEKKAIGQVLQRARVDVDERGTKAAAVTAVTMARATALLDDPFHIVFDRPFTWAVEHAPSGTQLFVGRVHHPPERSH
jgi:serine protease inhibitor